jgi:hypothetical protein
MSNRRPTVHVSEPKLFDYGDLDESEDADLFEDVRRADRRIVLALMTLVVVCVLFVVAVPILIVRSLR